MKDIDEQIRKALAREDAELAEHFGDEPSLQEQIVETFRGRQRWLVALSFTMTVVALGLLVLCGTRFAYSETTKDMIGWSTGFIWGLIFIAMTKIWYWGELNRNSVAREIKRLELQVAKLSRRTAEHGPA